MDEKKILIVDDEQDILRLLERRLTAKGYQVVMAHNGQEAVDKAREQLPNLVLLDIVMPDMDGAEVARKLKSDQATQQIPILFLSGIVTEDDSQKPKFNVKVGDRNFAAIPKPINFENLIDKVREVIK